MQDQSASNISAAQGNPISNDQSSSVLLLRASPALSCRITAFPEKCHCGSQKLLSRSTCGDVGVLIFTQSPLGCHKVHLGASQRCPLNSSTRQPVQSAVGFDVIPVEQPV